MINPYGFNQFPQYQYPFTQNTDQADEQSYIENILRLNLGKIISVYKFQIITVKFSFKSLIASLYFI